MKEYTKLKESRHDLRTVIPLAKPYTVLIEPSNFCNFRCVSCFQSLHSENYITEHRKQMSLEQFQAIIDQLKAWEGERLKVLKLSLYGEPFTNPHFCEMLRIAKHADIAERIETTTNASLITDEIARCLVDYGIDYIRVSIYGGNQARYREVTGVDAGNIDVIYQNLERIRTYKYAKKAAAPFVSAKMLDTFTSENEEFIRRFSTVADETYIDTPHNWVATEEKNFLESLYTSPEKLEQMKADREKAYRDRISCPMPFTTLAIRADGMVSPCCIDWQGGTNLASLKEVSLREIWEGFSLYAFRKMQLEGRNQENSSCRNCEFYKSSYYMLDDIDGIPVERLGPPPPESLD